MRSDHPNAKLVVDAMADMEQGPQAMADFMHDDIVWHEVDNPTPIHGKQAVIDAMSAVSDRVTFDFSVHDVLADDDLVIAYGRAKLTAGDRQTTYDAVEIHRLRDRKIIERWAMVGDKAAMHDFWDDL